MKIRAGFVSNSSSTSFLIIAADDLDRDSFFSLMGIDEMSPLKDVFGTLYETILDSSRRPIDLSAIPNGARLEDWFNDFQELTPKMIEKLEEGRQSGRKAYYGRLSTESTNAECFFCTDSFETENDRIYLNALECTF